MYCYGEVDLNGLIFIPDLEANEKAFTPREYKLVAWLNCCVVWLNKKGKKQDLTPIY
jgi:hypothetical protein